MSEMYEGVVFRCDVQTARHALRTIVSALTLRLVNLADGVFGVYRVAGHTDPVEQPALESVAKQLSERVDRAVALLYDNSCGLRSGVLYVGGRRARQFGDGDAWWVPYGENGELVLVGPRFRVTELDPDEEYDCVFSAIDAGLEAVGAGPEVNSKLTKQAFCYEELGWLMESTPKLK